MTYLEWVDTWGMVFKVEKCKVMYVGRNNPPYEYFMKGKKLITTEEEKDVSVYVSKSMKPTNQGHRAETRATGVLNQFRKNFHYRDRRTFVKLYVQYVQPHLEFALPAWSPWNLGEQEDSKEYSRRR